MLKESKKPSTIYKNLKKLNTITKMKYTDKELLGIANARQGLYKRSNYPIINFLLSPKVLATRNMKKNRLGLVDPYTYYLSKL